VRISRGEKMELKELLAVNDKKSIKDLFKLYNCDLEDINDKYFVLINLAIINKRNKNFDGAKIYLNELIGILNTYEGFEMEKAVSLWLYIELEKNKLTKDELLEIYINIYNNVKHLGEDDETVLATKGNIAFLNDDYEMILDIFESCLDRQYIQTSTAILKELSEKNLLIYNKAIKIEQSLKAIKVNI